MDLTTITMDRDEAHEAYLDYRKAVTESDDPSAEDEAIMRGYRELARGSRLIRLSDTIRAGGVDDKGLPKLAVMRADAPWCWVHRHASTGNVSFQPRQRVSSLLKKGVYRFPRLLPPVPWEQASNEWWFRYRAMVPPVPPALRPKWRLGNYEVLWEATWELRPQPPGDPALLRHIGGDLYAVLAVWDLTELERAVLAGRTGE